MEQEHGSVRLLAGVTRTSYQEAIMYEVINIKRPHSFSGLYGVEILSKHHDKVVRFHDYWMELVGKEWQIFFQGGSFDFPKSDWVFVDLTITIADELKLKVDIV
jgi:hypothetical protein